MTRESDKIVSIAVLKARAGMREPLREALLTLIAPTRREPGNLDYVLFELKDEPGTFYMREAFVSQGQADILLAEPLRLIFMEEVSPG